jgi:hypothetical protein
VAQRVGSMLERFPELCGSSDGAWTLVAHVSG